MQGSLSSFFSGKHEQIMDNSDKTEIFSDFFTAFESYLSITLQV